jgi:ketosteroid isomerase-like protein
MRRLGMWTLLPALSLLLTLVAGGAMAQAQQSPDRDQIRAIILSFDAALSARDLAAVERIWAHEPYVVVVSPRDKAFSFGWDAVKQHWEDVFEFWSFLKVSVLGEPRIHVTGNMAWASTVVNAAGQVRNGGPLEFTTLVTDVFEKRGDRWLMTAHHASRMPE